MNILIQDESPNAFQVIAENKLENSLSISLNTAQVIYQVASQSEVNAGLDTTHPVVSSALNSFVTTKAFAKTYFNSDVSTVANTPLAVTHNLGLQNKDAFIVSIKNSLGSEVSVGVDSIDTNTLTITSAIGLSNLKVCIIGF